MDFINEYNTNEDKQTSIFDTDTADFLKIKVFGVGGGGCNAVSRLRDKVTEGVEFIASNTDMMALSKITASGIKKLQLGKVTTQGIGAGANPEVGKEAARESREEIKELITGANMLFITAGMGGGTGTGGAPVVAGIAKELGILTVAVVTKPFKHEAPARIRVAEDGIEKLKKEVDVIIVVPNSKAFECAPKNTPIRDILKLADDVLLKSIIGITDIMLNHSTINLDFADIRTVIKDKKTAHIGVARAQGENRMMEALRKACSSQMLDTSIAGAKYMIVSVMADYELSGDVVQKALELVPEVADPNVNIIQGLGFDENLKDEVVITVIATGFDDNETIEEIKPETPSNEDIDLLGSLLPMQKSIKKPVESNVEISENEIPDFLKRIKDRN